MYIIQSNDDISCYCSGSSSGGYNDGDDGGGGGGGVGASKIQIIPIHITCEFECACDAFSSHRFSCYFFFPV